MSGSGYGQFDEFQRQLEIGSSLKKVSKRLYNMMRSDGEITQSVTGPMWPSVSMSSPSRAPVAVVPAAAPPITPARVPVLSAPVVPAAAPASASSASAHITSVGVPKVAVVPVAPTIAVEPVAPAHVATGPLALIDALKEIQANPGAKDALNDAVRAVTGYTAIKKRTNPNEGTITEANTIKFRGQKIELVDDPSGLVNVSVGGMKFPATDGLLTLLFANSANESTLESAWGRVTRTDQEMYIRVLYYTSPLIKNYTDDNTMIKYINKKMPDKLKGVFAAYRLGKKSPKYYDAFGKELDTNKVDQFVNAYVGAGVAVASLRTGHSAAVRRSLAPVGNRISKRGKGGNTLVNADRETIAAPRRSGGRERSDKRLQILLGEIKAGNNSRAIYNELRSLSQG